MIPTEYVLYRAYAIYDPIISAAPNLVNFLFLWKINSSPAETINQKGISKFISPLEIGLSVIIAPIPSAIIGFVMLDPIKTPNDSDSDFLNSPITAVVNSGSAVAKPIIKSPKKDCSIPSVFEKFRVISTIVFAANCKIPNPTKIMTMCDVKFLNTFFVHLDLCEIISESSFSLVYK